MSLEVSAVEDVLAKLIPSETSEIEVRNRELRTDGRLRDLAGQLNKLDESLAGAKQACKRALNAREVLAGFAAAGVDELHRAGWKLQRWNGTKGSAEDILPEIRKVSQGVAAFEVPGLEDVLAEIPESERVELRQLDLELRWNRLGRQIQAVEQEMSAWIDDVTRILESLARNQERLQVEVEQALAERGLDAAKLKELQELNRQASFLSSYEANLDETLKQFAESAASFGLLQVERQELVQAQRTAFDRVMAEVEFRFGGWIRARRIDNGVVQPLDTFLRSLRRKGITRGGRIWPTSGSLLQRSSTSF